MRGKHSGKKNNSSENLYFIWCDKAVIKSEYTLIYVFGCEDITGNNAYVTLFTYN